MNVRVLGCPKTGTAVRYVAEDYQNANATIFIFCPPAAIDLLGGRHRANIMLRISMGCVREFHLADELGEIERYLRFESELLSVEGMFERNRSGMKR